MITTRISTCNLDGKGFKFTLVVLCVSLVNDLKGEQIETKTLNEKVYKWIPIILIFLVLP